METVCKAEFNIKKRDFFMQVFSMHLNRSEPLEVKQPQKNIVRI